MLSKTSTQNRKSSKSDSTPTTGKPFAIPQPPSLFVPKKRVNLIIFQFKSRFQHQIFPKALYCSRFSGETFQ
jgi:hypothetical protein